MASTGLISLRLLRRPDGSDPGLPALRIDVTGAVIGRAPDCDLVLEDALRLISRQHAMVLPRDDGSALLRCLSTSAAVGVNGDAVPPGGERLVRAGDRLRVGGFELLVEAFAVLETPDTGPEAAAEPAAVLAPPGVPAAAVRGRLDQWFDLDDVADPLAPGSPLPLPAATPTVLNLAPAGNSELAGPRPTDFARTGMTGPPAAPAPNAAATQQESSASVSPTITEAALQQAFLRGAGLVGHPQAARWVPDAAWMQHVGALLRATTEGTLSLLRSRAVTKRSIRAEGTQIAQRENNPLKFAPDGAEALLLLLSRQGAAGFLEPIDALRDAHKDLLVHQLAMVAGMRAAVFELISRFGPEAIETQQGAPKGWARWLPWLHQAALWRRHRDQHAHLVANLDDDFEAVFGREFLRAYEAQSRLAAEPHPPAKRDP